MATSRGSADNLFERIAAGKPDRISLDGPRRVAARTWFRERAAEITQVNTKQYFNSADKSRKVDYVGKNDIGRMFSFWYDAKLKKKLPYWDRFPLIFLIESYSDGFLGINLHYLPLSYRARLMDALYRTANNRSYDATTRLIISYQILKSATKYRYFKPCVKRYLFSHVNSQFMRIDANEWDMALMLPTERFQKEKREVVWQESVSQLTGNGTT
jgi:hypothetical protein